MKKWEHLPHLTKNFYNEHPDVSNMTNEEVVHLRLNRNKIAVSRVFAEKAGESPPIPNPITVNHKLRIVYSLYFFKSINLCKFNHINITLFEKQV